VRKRETDKEFNLKTIIGTGKNSFKIHPKHQHRASKLREAKLRLGFSGNTQINFVSLNRFWWKLTFELGIVLRSEILVAMRDWPGYMPEM
jgi:hypothetical protein